MIVLLRPIECDSVSRHLHLPVAAASALVLAGLTRWHRGLSRLDGALLLALYGAYSAAAISLSS